MAALQLPGWRVLVTAVHPREREQVAERLVAAGAEVLSAFSIRDPPHLVITRSVRSPKYRALMRAHPHTPVVTPDWLAASVQAGTQQAYDSFRAGPFLGLTVCLSGFNAPTKAALAAAVARGGGAHSPALDKKCTHLVTTSTSSEKYKFASRENIPVVTTKWVEDSERAGWCLDEAAYGLADTGGEGAGQTGGAAPLPPPAAPPAAAPTAAALTLMDEATNLGEPLGMACVPPSCAAPTAGEPAARPPSRLQRAGSAMPPEQCADALALQAQTAAAQQAAAAARQVAQQAAAHQAALEAQLEWDDETSTFLDAVRLRLLGCSPAESQEALALVRQGAAKRFADWRDDLHYIVVGSDLTAAEAADALDFLSAHRSCVPVTLDWLRQARFSVAAQQRLHPDGFLVPTSRLAQYRRRPPVLEQIEAAGRMERSMGEGMGEGAVVGAGAAAGGAGELARAQSTAVLSGPLEGHYFTLAALRGTEQEAHARRLVQENGGRLFTETTVQRITDKGKAFALCPDSLVAQRITQLRSSSPDFKLVDEKNRFTLFWLECSLLAGGPLPPNRGAPLYQPLPYPLPMPSMRDVVVCTSGYDEEVRRAIKRTVETLGGTVTPESMTRRNTHLILPEAGGRKYEHCAPFGVIPVTADWLVDTVQVGRRQAEDNYRPRQPAGQPPLPGGARLNAFAAAAEHSRGSSGAAAPSQIATTQMGGGATQAAQQRQQRQALVLPAPPAQAAPGAGGRRPTLRERARASQALAGVAAHGGITPVGPLAAGAASGWPGAQAPLQAVPPNDENEGSNSQPTADLLQLGGKQALTTSFAQPAAQHPQQQAAAPPAQQQQQQQRSALDDVMADLDAGLSAQQAEAAMQQQQQQEEEQQHAAVQQGGSGRQSGRTSGSAPKPSSLFDELFGPDPPPGSNAATAAAAPAAPLPATTAMPPVQAVPAADPAASSGGAAAAPAGPRSAQKQPAVRSSGRAQRTSSRLRPNAQQQQQQPAAPPAEQSPAAAMETEPPAEAAAPPALAELAGSEAAGTGSGSEPQDDVARALDKLSNKLLVGLQAAAAPGCGSQMDVLMPPPPARARAAIAKRGAAAPAESTLSNDSGDSHGGRASKRPTLTDDGAGSGGSGGQARPARRSGRRGAELPPALPHLEMSQQVGYADFEAAAPPPARLTRNSAAAAAGAADKQQLKRHLAEAAAAGRATTRRGAAAAGAVAAAARSADPLADLLS
ncbi:hypothetical protein ABPG75_003617 [Micractinium tetrahymenae]